MAEKDIIRNAIARPGQSQDERTPRELDVHYADIDERTTADLLKFARDLAPFIGHYDADGGPTGDWTSFFDYTDEELEALVARKDGEMQPHLALYLSFLELYKRPQKILNKITGRHLDFYYRDVLRQSERPAVADRAHLLVELKKGSSPTLVGTAHSFSAGKDSSGVELIYTPVRDTIVNTSVVDSLRTVYLDRTGYGTLRYAPIANSADGLGAEFETDDAKWSPFGSKSLPAGEVGFALASTVLRMAEGKRTVTAKIALGNLNSTKVTTATLAHAFEIFLTGEKGWLGPVAATPTLVGSTLTLTFTIDSDQDAVIDYDQTIHGYAYGSGAPVMQVHLNSASTTIGYLDLQKLTIQTAEITVDVSEITSLALESDTGSLDPKKAFLPFGPQPTRGARFLVGYSEALTKKLSSLSLTLQWKDTPADGSFTNHYALYNKGVTNSYFTAGVKFRDGSGHEYSETQTLFDATDAGAAHVIRFSPGRKSLPIYATPSMRIFALSAVGGRSASFLADQYVLRSPVYAPARTVLPPAREGYVSFALTNDFLHATYRKRLVEDIVAATQNKTTLTLLNEPYTPTIQSITLSYSAHSQKVNIASATLNDFAGGDVQFYHIAPTGVRREHSYLRGRISFLTEKSVPLVPSFAHDGELEIGLSNLEAGDSVSLLFQAAEGSADPELSAGTVSYYVLSDNYWKPIGAGDLALDTTNGFLTSGLVQVVIASDATADNTILPSGMIWLKVGLKGEPASVSKLVDVAANAVEVRFTDNGNDPSHLESAQAAGTITKLKTSISTVKTITQPYGSFGGSPEETSEAFYTRVSERLRHKNRCITIWDYERIILDAFPRVHRVKCIPHAKEGVWGAPGNVLIVVVPDLRNKNALDPLQPRVDADTLDRITELVQAQSGMGVRAKVKNPSYQKIRLDFKVRFHDGYEFNYYRNALEQEIIKALSPWAYDASREITFGGAIYKSVLLDVVEELAYVDYVTDFKMYSYSADAPNTTDINVARADAPDMILVSDAGHTIGEA